LPSNKPAAGELGPRAERWPVLARFAEIRRDDEQTPARPPASTEPSYRLDVFFLMVRRPPRSTPEARPLKVSASSLEPRSVAPLPPPKIAAPQKIATGERDDHPAPPAPLRAAGSAWQFVEPHQELIRFAAMLALMVAAGMSAVLMMRGRLQPASDTMSPVAATTSQPSDAQPAVQHAELEPTLEPQLAPDTDTSSLEPTATGPLSPPAKPVMAVESKEPPVALPYPTTSLAEVTLPPAVDPTTLPQVQTTDREVALKGSVIETQVR
jgi:hypothetical protein